MLELYSLEQSELTQINVTIEINDLEAAIFQDFSMRHGQDNNEIEQLNSVLLEVRRSKTYEENTAAEHEIQSEEGSLAAGSLPFGVTLPGTVVFLGIGSPEKVWIDFQEHLPGRKVQGGEPGPGQYGAFLGEALLFFCAIGLQSLAYCNSYIAQKKRKGGELPPKMRLIGPDLSQRSREVYAQLEAEIMLQDNKTQGFYTLRFI